MLAGLAGANTSKGTNRFDADDPSSASVLISTLRVNETRNDSVRTHQQSLDEAHEHEQEVLDELLAEEQALLAADAAASRSALVDAASAAEGSAIRAGKASRTNGLEEKLAAFRPQLSSAVDALCGAYDTLEDAPVRVMNSTLELPARNTPPELTQRAEDAVLVVALELELERIDSLMQQMSARITRIKWLRKEDDDDSYNEGEGGGTSTAIDPALRVFSEPKEGGAFAAVKAVRHELEAVVSRHKELDELEG